MRDIKTRADTMKFVECLTRGVYAIMTLGYLARIVDVVFNSTGNLWADATLLTMWSLLASVALAAYFYYSAKYGSYTITLHIPGYEEASNSADRAQQTKEETA